MAKVKLTVNVVKATAARDKDQILWDAELPGLGLKVTPKGKRVFFLYYRTADHTQRKPRIGDYPAMKPEKAREIARDWLAEVRAGNDPSSERIAKRLIRGTGTVADFVEEYKAANTGLRSLNEISRIFDRDILPSIGKQRAEDVTRRDVSRMLDSLARRSPSTASNARKRLSAFYNWTLPRLPHGASNPVIGAVRPKAPPARDRVLSNAELKALWTVLDSEAEPWKTALRLLILTGQRRGEVFEANWDEFDLSAKTWQIPASRTKNSKVHIVPLPAPVISLLGRTKVGKLFPSSEGGQRAWSRAARRIRVALEKELSCSVPSWSWHDIRRTVATGMQRLGVRLEVTEAVLNHVSGSRAGIVGVYQRYDWADEKRAALEAWGRYVAKVNDQGAPRRQRRSARKVAAAVAMPLQSTGV